MKEVTVSFCVDVDFLIDEDYLTKELMDNYEKHFSDVNNHLDYGKLKNRKERHIANIAWYLMNESPAFIEGYGATKNFIKNENTSLMGIDEIVVS